MCTFNVIRHKKFCFTFILFSIFSSQLTLADDNDSSTNGALVIKQANWKDDDNRVKVTGVAGGKQAISLFNAVTGELLGKTKSEDDGVWKISLRIRSNNAVPCSVRAENNNQTDVQDVRRAPDNCDGQGGGTVPPSVVDNNFTILAANDLGMHCADLDYRVFSILPPFNVVHAQVIQKGTSNSLPQIVTNSTVDVLYSATSSINDPAGANSINTTSENLPGIYKANFWDLGSATSTIGGNAYSPLYPSVLVVDPGNTCQLTFDCPSALSLFEPITVNTGIPVPDPSALYPEVGLPAIVIGQQSMPGLSNAPQAFDRFDTDLPFFVNFPFGSRIKNVNWFAADGIPILPVDDTGVSNAYPLMKIAAHSRQDGTQLASVDVVLPVASEADCQNCHVEPIDCADPGLPGDVISNSCNGSAVAQTAFDVMTLDDNPPGETRLEQLLNTAKINILRLHDVKHGVDYKNWDNSGELNSTICDASNPADPNCLINQTPIQCSQCHYSPALDLTQSGPVDEPQQGTNGRQQTIHISMSRAMHGHHGALSPFQGQDLFPAMPAPVNRSEQVAQQVLEQTCYQCHPGKRTQCLRGAMASGGVVCQDCHGNMEQVGNDFTANLPQTPFPAGADLTRRVPWASEPGCQSCHTGDAVTNLSNTAGTIPADSHGIRLRQAYLQDDVDATPIVAVNKRFAENESLYRLSKGHGGVMCEACHGSTHAIWPISNPLANDNIAAQQLQGHSGTIIECTTCHAAGSLGLTLGGPHGMHPVGDSDWNSNHEDFAERNLDSCRSCHGQNGEGTVLSRLSVTRTLKCDEGPGCNNENITLAKGTQIGCGTCHENELHN